MKKIVKHYVYLLPFGLVFPFEKFSVYLILLFFVLELINNYKIFKENFSIKFFLHPLIILFISILLLTKLRHPIAEWDRDLTLFFFPIYFSVRKLKRFEINKILKSFVWFLFISLMFSITYEFTCQLYFSNFKDYWKLHEYYNDSYFFYSIHAVSERIGFHHIYFSLYLFIGFIIGHHLLEKKIITKKSQVLFTKISMITFLAFTLMSISRISIICFLLYGIYYIFKTKSKYGLILLGIVLACFLIFPNSINSKFSKIKKDPRINLFNTSLILIKDKLYFGYGYKEGQKKLIDKQLNLKKTVIYNNPHNQFLNYILSGGLLMFLIFLFIIFTFIYKFYKSNFLLGLLFVFFFLIQCFTESLLERYRGIVLFSFFLSLFYYLDSIEKKEKINNSYIKF